MLGTAAVVLVLAAAGCGGSGADEADATATTVEPSTTSEPTSPPTTTLTEEQAVLTAYQGYWDAVLAAGDPADSSPPDLAEVAIGAALERSLASVEQRRSVGQVVRLRADSRYRHEASLESLDSAQAVVSDCSVDDGLVVDYGSGRVLDDSVVTRELRATLVNADGRWLVEDIVALAEWEGITGCAE